MLDATIDVRLADLARFGPTLHPDDSLSKALHQLRLSPGGTLPVIADGRLLGVVAEVDLLDALRRSGVSWADSGLEAVTVETAMTRDVTTARTETSLASAWETMATGRFKVLPVVNERGGYQGIVSRNDLLAAMHRDLRPESVGGLATPLGVYLTTGDHRAGAGDLGLFLTGVVMALCHLVVINGLEGLAIALGVQWPAWPVAIAEFGLYLLLLRLTPLAGFHAAEHQVVHTIERGEPLVMAHVARQPREHPRCGTNLVALMFGAQLLMPLAANPAIGLLSAVMLFLAWRKMGWAFQRFFTTKKPSEWQLGSAVSAGRNLLASYGARPAYRATRLGRLWATGFMQIVAGFVGVLAVVQLLNLLLPQLGILA